ncbi:MAG: MBL fold metallo-hydrolase [Mailhella sp.]|nr:MBL fold metallo-hydrolase [Mailhella sp.]
MPVITLSFGLFEANCHIVHNGRDAVVFDPADDTCLVRDTLAAQGLTLRGVALTHLHADHCLGCAGLTEATGLIPIVGKEDWEDRSLLLCKGMCFGMDLKPFSAIPVSEGRFSWGGLECEALHTPGHSPGSLCYYFAGQGVAITGDVLFYRSVGRSDLPGGNAGQLMESIRSKVYALPDSVLVYPGHGPATSVGEEKAGNSFCPAKA